MISLSDSEQPLVFPSLVSQLEFTNSIPQPFVTKLHHALEHPGQFGDVMRWTRSGMSFFISLSNPRLTSEVLPHLFSHDSVSAFTRQLSVRLSLDPLLLVVIPSPARNADAITDHRSTPSHDYQSPSSSLISPSSNYLFNKAIGEFSSIPISRNSIRPLFISFDREFRLVDRLNEIVRRGERGVRSLMRAEQGLSVVFSFTFWVLVLYLNVNTDDSRYHYLLARVRARESMRRMVSNAKRNPTTNL